MTTFPIPLLIQHFMCVFDCSNDYIKAFFRTTTGHTNRMAIATYLADQTFQHYYAGVFSSYEEFFLPLKNKLSVYVESQTHPPELLESFLFLKLFKLDFKNLADSLAKNNYILVFEESPNKIHIFYDLYYLKSLIHYGDTVTAISICKGLFQIVGYDNKLTSAIKEIYDQILAREFKSRNFLLGFKYWPEVDRKVLYYNKQSITFAVTISILGDSTLFVKVQGNDLIELLRTLDNIFCAETDSLRKLLCSEDIERFLIDNVRRQYHIPEDIIFYKNYEEPFSFFTDKLTIHFLNMIF